MRPSSFMLWSQHPSLSRIVPSTSFYFLLEEGRNTSRPHRLPTFLPSFHASHHVSPPLKSFFSGPVQGPEKTRFPSKNTISFKHTRNSRKVGREDEGVSSTRPEMVALAECLEDHDDDISLLYLTDIEAILQVIHRWIGYGVKLNLSKSPDPDVLKKIIIKLQKRVLVGAVTLLVKVCRIVYVFHTFLARKE